MYSRPHSFFCVGLRYDTTEEFNVDSKAECDQLNLAHVARKKEKKLKQTVASTPWSWSMLRLAVVVGWRVTDDRS